MIAKMKKYTFLIFHKEHQSFLHALRELGVVHVIEKQSGMIEENSDLYGFVHNGKRFTSIIRSLNKLKEDHQITDLHPIDKQADGIAILENIEQLYLDREQALQHKSALKKELERITPWGQFDPKSLKQLEKVGMFVHFHIAKSKFDEKWIDDYNAVKISQYGSTICFLTITNDPMPPDIRAEQITPFENSAKTLKANLTALDDDIKEIDESLKKIVKKDLNTLIYREKKVGDQINWEKVALSSEKTAGEKIMLLEGYVPEEKAAETTEALQDKGVYFEVTNPKISEKPPILLKNRLFARSFELISNLYDRPNYHAFDLTPFYAPFYVLFFGLCVGDCGYGLIYILLSFLLKKSTSSFMKSAGKLLLWLGIGTVIFGFISGTFFGIPLVEQEWAWLEKFKIIMLNDKKLFYGALICGVVQLIYAMFINVVTKWIRFGFVYSLNMMGWIVTLLGIGIPFALTKTGVITSGMPTTFMLIAGVIGAFMMLFFNNPKEGLKGVPGSIGSGLFGLFTKVSGILGDTLSYIRLFALGIAGGVMGLVFNSLAFSFAPDTIILKQLVIVVILLIGHTLNILMCSLGGFVHPLRLTFVEFFNNAGFEGSGKPYMPFKKQ